MRTPRKPGAPLVPAPALCLSRPRAAAGRAALGGLAASLMIGLAACGTTVAGTGTSGAGSAAAPASSLTAAPSPTGVNPGGPNVPAASAGRPALCRAIPQLRRMTIVPFTGPPNLHVHEVLPGGFTVRDAATVRLFATLLCALPVVPPGHLMCMTDPVGGSYPIRGSYRLYFFAPGRNIGVVGLQLAGCRLVTGLGPARSWSTSVSLQQALTQRFGIHFPLGPKS